MANILVLNDNASHNAALIEMLEKLKHKVFAASTIQEATSQLRKTDVAAIFIDLQNDNKANIQSLTALKKEQQWLDVPAVVITSKPDSNQMIETIRLGAFDHLNKPVSLNELESIINRALAKPKQSLAVNQQFPGDFLIGLSTAMQQVEKLIGMAAASSCTVLIAGEPGTGKDTVARAIYTYAQPKVEPLTVIDCTAIPEDYGSFESLSKNSQGTVILDEVGDLNEQMQAMLMRALKEAPSESSIDPAKLRIIATSQHDLVNMVKEKRFREDLYYRLNVLPMFLPPLRDRGSDILALAERFLQQANPNSEKRISSSAAKLLLDYEWPGNVRELQNLMYHLSIVVRASVIEEADLNMLKAPNNQTHNEEKQLEQMDYYNAVATLEKRLLLRALKEAHGSRAEAARLLGVNRQFLYAKLKAHRLMN